MFHGCYTVTVTAGNEQLENPSSCCLSHDRDDNSEYLHKMENNAKQKRLQAIKKTTVTGTIEAKDL